MQSSDRPNRPNPYIGPRSFAPGERLYGRERELRALLHLLIAERVVLLHSPSGAGKSSLIQAALIPALEHKHFAVLPTIRLNQQPPGHANRYVFSTLLSLEEHRDPHLRLPLDTLARLSLPDYLQQQLLPAIRTASRDPLLLFDQFEEVLTLAPTDLAAKHAFFEQLGQALADRQLWALLAMREDHLAALDPYLAYIPTRFKDTFRLDLLGVEAARQAMHGPALAAGVSFTPQASARLADELRRVLVQRPDGSLEQVLGPYVEPVQLQVVCLRLWEHLFGQPSAHPPEITPDDLADVGDVDSALADYYQQRVRAVVAATGVGERAVRDWFDRRLITPQGQRGQVMREPGQSGGLDNRAVAALIDAHLVRADQRHGTLWYELAHDRLVAPVRESNAAWRLQTLTAFQRQALLWEEQGRSEGLLLQGAPLQEAEQWAAGQADTLTPNERAFLEACQKARAMREQQEHANRRTRRALAATALALLLAVGLAGVAVWQGRLARERQRSAEVAQQEAEQQRSEALQQKHQADTQRQRASEQARIARQQELAALALATQDQTPQRSLLLSVAAQQISVPTTLAVGLDSLIDGLNHSGGTPLPGSQGEVDHLAFSPDGATLASGGQDGSVRLWQVQHPGAPPTVLRGHKGSITALAFSPDGTTLASASQDATARLWRVDRPDAPPRVLRGHTAALTALAFSPDGRILASASKDASARLWRLERPDAPPTVLRGHTDALTALAFSSDGRILASASKDASARIWRVDRPDAPPSVLRGHAQAITALAFSPDNALLATGSLDGEVRLWQSARPDNALVELPGHEGLIAALAFSPDGATLASAGFDATIRLWPVGSPDEAPLVLREHESMVQALAFSPNGQILASASNDGSIRLARFANPDSTPLVLRGHDGSVKALAFSPDGSILASSGSDDMPRLWRVDDPAPLPAALRGLNQLIYGLAFRPDGRVLATSNDDGSVRLWHLDTPEQPPTVLRADTKWSFPLTFSPDGHSLAVGGEDGAVRLWRLDTPAQAPAVMAGHTDTLSQLGFSPDGRLLATSSLDGALLLWRTAEPSAAPVSLREHGPATYTAQFSPDGRLLASSSEDGSVLIWQMARPDAAPKVLRSHAGPVYALAFSPDGHLLASAGSDGIIRLWRTDNLDAAPLSLPGHEQDITALAFNPAGSILASASNDGSIRLWRFTSFGSAPTVLRGIQGVTYCLVFSPDGHLLLSTSEDGSARLWRLHDPSDPASASAEDPRTIADLERDPRQGWRSFASTDSSGRHRQLQAARFTALACATAGRNLTLAEWRQYFGAEPYAKLCPGLPRHPSVYAELLAHGQFAEALLAHHEDRSADPALDADAPWLVEQAAALSQEHPSQALLAVLLAHQLDPRLQGASPAALAQLCRAAGPPSVFQIVCDSAAE